MSKNQRPLPQPLRFRQRRSGNLPRPVQLVNNFFFRTPKFFSERAARVSPRRRSGNLSRPLLAVNHFLLLFSKNLFAPPCPASRPARLSETFRPAAARTVYAPPRRLCTTLLYFFSDFFLHPRQRPFDVWCLIRGYHMLSLITCRQLPSGVFTVIALWKRPRPRSARQRRVPEQT